MRNARADDAKEADARQVFFRLVTCYGSEDGKNLALPMTRHMEDRILRRKSILFAEDELSVRWATRLLLKADGHEVTEAETGRAALDLFSRGRFDLVITDFQMPGMTGKQLAARIKGLAPDQPILLITAYEDNVSKQDCSVDRTLTKPFTFEELRQAITSLLSTDLEEMFPAGTVNDDTTMCRQVPRPSPSPGECSAAENSSA